MPTVCLFNKCCRAPPTAQWQTSYAAPARLPGGPNVTADPTSADADGQPRHARALAPEPNPEHMGSADGHYEPVAPCSVANHRL